jgi:pantetheine-phosphate adenylyltransferase
MRVVYPGTFDPVHYGHVDLIERASRRFEAVDVTVFRNPAKVPTFSTEERVEMLRAAVGHLANVTVSSFDGLAAAYARERGADALLRGLRPVLDFDFEFQMGMMNRKIAPEVDTIFLLTSPQHSFLSSTLIKEVAMFGGNLDGLVPEGVAERLRRALGAAGADRGSRPGRRT